MVAAVWGAPAWNRLKSYDNPTRCIRHTDHALRIGPVSTATERQDATTFYAGC